ncbi:uncharacterized protein METZ01_LOCUS55152, partial [marine metagenome]
MPVGDNHATNCLVPGHFGSNDFYTKDFRDY